MLCCRDVAWVKVEKGKREGPITIIKRYVYIKNDIYNQSESLVARAIH